MLNLQNTLKHIVVCFKSLPSNVVVNKVSYYDYYNNYHQEENLKVTSIPICDGGNIDCIICYKNNEMKELNIKKVESIDITLTTTHTEERFICDNENYTYNVKHFEWDEGYDNLEKRKKE